MLGRIWESVKFAFAAPQSAPVREPGEVGTFGPTLGRGWFYANFDGTRFNPDELVRVRGPAIYRQMLRDDQIAAALSLVNAAVTARAWSFDVDDAATQQAAADFLRWNLESALQGTVRQLMEQLLFARVPGFSLIEKIHAPVTWQGKTYWGLKAFKLRPSWSFTFKTDVHGNIEGLVQEQQTGGSLELDPARFIHFVWQPELDPHYGASALVPAYRPWWVKENVGKFWTIYLERMAGGLVHAQTVGPISQQALDALTLQLKNLQSATSLTTPGSVKIDYKTPPSTEAFERSEAAQNRAIARALLLPMHLGYTDQGSTGSHAQAATQMDAFFWWMDSLASRLEDTLNEQLFRDLVRWNFGDIEPPRFRFDRLTAAARLNLATAWISALAGSGVQWQAEDELALRSLLGMPDKTPDSRAPNEIDDLPEDSGYEVNPISTAQGGTRTNTTRAGVGDE